MNTVFIFNAILLFICIKIIKWLANYIYQIWIYSHINGPRILPFLGNFLRLNKPKSGKKLAAFINYSIFMYLEILIEYQKIVKEYGNGPFLRIWTGTLPIVLFHKADELEVNLFFKFTLLSIQLYF
jgi:hypothetical protein